MTAPLDDAYVCRFESDAAVCQVRRFHKVGISWFISFVRKAEPSRTVCSQRSPSSASAQ